MMDALHIRLFGRISVLRGGTEMREMMPPKAQELLAYLLLFRERWHTRERLASELWPDANALDARARLRRLIWRLQTRLCEDDAASRLLVVENEWLGINADADIWLDVAEVEDTYRDLGTVDSVVLPPGLVDRLQQTTSLIHGDLLDNWYQEWCIVERERLRIIQISMLARLVSHYVASREISRGFSAASDILRIDRAHEGAHREMMRLHLMAGDRTGALRQFEVCRRILEEEFGVVPEGLTLTLNDQIRRELPGDDTATATPEPLPLATNQLVIEVLHSQFNQLQAAVVESQDRLWKELRSLKAMIRVDFTNDGQSGRRQG